MFRWMLRPAIVLLLACLAATGCTPAAPSSGSAPLPPTATHAIKVATYNVHFERPRPEETLAAIRGLHADVLCLQETTADWQRELEAEFAATYPHRAFLPSPGGRGGGGLAILSRLAFDPPVTHDPPEDGWWPAWQTAVHTPAGRLQVLLVHLRPALEKPRRFTLGAYFGTGTVRLREMKHYLSQLRQDVPTVVLGDFNEAPTGQAMRLLAESGYVNALDAFGANKPTWSWPGVLWPVTASLDHICHSTHLACSRGRVVEEGGSDHYPVVATLHFLASRGSDATGARHATGGDLSPR